MDTLNHEFVDPMSGDTMSDDPLEDDLVAALDAAVAEVDQQPNGEVFGLQDLIGDTAREVDANRDHHAKAYSAYLRRIENAQRHKCAELAEIADEKRRLRQKYDDDLHRLDSEAKAIEAAATAEIATAKKLANASKVALEALQP